MSAMKSLRLFFKLSIVLSLLKTSLFAESIKNLPLQGESRNTAILDKISANTNLNDIIKSASKAGETLFIVKNSSDLKLLLKSDKKESVIMGWSSRENTIPHSAEKDNGRFIFTDKQSFDLWLLSEKELLNELVNNIDFLRLWLPEKNTIKVKDPLKKAQAYIFSIKTPRKNFSLASVIGEDRFFPDLTSNDKELNFMNLPILHYTTASDGIRTVYYCHIDGLRKLRLLEKYINLFWADPNQKKLFIEALKNKRFTGANYNFPANKTFLADLKKKLSDNSQQYDLSNIPTKYIPDLISNIKNFLLSNKVASFKDLESADDVIKSEIADRFYNAKTTAFFREWREMKFLASWMEEKDNELSEQAIPLKIKVYGCSTGQEVLSYAIDLLEHGVSNFKILASDIDPKVLAEAESMTYPEEKFLTIPSSKKRDLLENYFELTHENKYRIRFMNFFRERIHFMIQDITRPLDENNIPEEFKPPYNLISVKNIFLYLDKESVLKSVQLIKEIADDGSILIIRDKKNKAAQFTLKEKKDQFIPITSYTLYKMPEFSEAEFDDTYRMFSKNQPPQLVNFFYKFAKLNNFTNKVNWLALSQVNNSSFNYDNLELLIDFYAGKNDYNEVWNNLKLMIQHEPIKAFSFISKLSSVIDISKLKVGKSLRKTISLVKMLADPTYDDHKSRNILLEKINDFTAQNHNIYMLNIIMHAMAARDLGRFFQVNPSDDGWWMSKAIDIILPIINMKYITADEEILLLESITRLLSLKMQFFPKIFKNSDITNHKVLLDKLLSLDYTLMSQYGRISAGKVTCMFAKNQSDFGEKRKLYHHALNIAEMNDETIDLLSDRWLGEYYSVMALANIEMGRSSAKALLQNDKIMYFNDAIDYLEKGLAVKTVYANKEIRQIKMLKKELNKN